MSLPRPGVPPVRPDERRSLVAEFLRLVIEAGADGFVFETSRVSPILAIGPCWTDSFGMHAELATRRRSCGPTLRSSAYRSAENGYLSWGP